MNEPSAFGIWNKSIPKDCLLGSYTDREVHNAYGTFQSAATFDGMIRRDNRRPFSLTRSYFAGSQRYAWAWTGDNGSSFLHMCKSVSMIANAGLCGMPFIGADVGGFSSTCDPVVLTRWYQAAAWTYPFFREHCIFTAARREPYLHAPALCALMREAVVQRYRMMPFWYTAAWRAHRRGAPLVRPTFVDFGDSEYEHDRDGEVVVDGSVFFSPSTEVVSERAVRLPPGAWFDLEGRPRAGEVIISGALEFTPVFFRAGRIIPTMTAIAKSTAQCLERNLTLLVLEDSAGRAEGDIYIDDYETREHETGAWAHRKFTWEGGTLSCVAGERPEPEIGAVPRRLCDTVIVRSESGTVTLPVSLVLTEDWAFTPA
jgi:alpha 1,3-glucosidase